MNQKLKSGLLITAALLIPTAQAQEQVTLEKGGNPVQNVLRQISGYMDKACTMVQRVGNAANTAQSGVNVASSLAGLVGMDPSFADALTNGIVTVKRIISNGRFICTLNEMTNYAANVIDVNTWKSLGQDIMQGFASNNTQDAFGDIPDSEFEGQMKTLFASLKNNVETFKKNVQKIGTGYTVNSIVGTTVEGKASLAVALTNPNSLTSLIDSRLAAGQAVQEKLLLNIARQEQVTTDEAMQKQQEATTDLSKDLLGNGDPTQGQYNELDAQAAKDVSTRKAVETVTNAITTTGRAQVIYNERIADALTNIARGQALSNAEMTRKSEEEYDRVLQQNQMVDEENAQTLNDVTDITEQAGDDIGFTGEVVKNALTIDENALDDWGKY